MYYRENLAGYLWKNKNKPSKYNRKKEKIKGHKFPEFSLNLIIFHTSVIS